MSNHATLAAARGRLTKTNVETHGLDASALTKFSKRDLVDHIITADAELVRLGSLVDGYQGLTAAIVVRDGIALKGLATLVEAIGTATALTQAGRVAPAERILSLALGVALATAEGLIAPLPKIAALPSEIGAH